MLRETLALAHPVIPFVTEEIWSLRVGRGCSPPSGCPRSTRRWSTTTAEAEVDDAIDADPRAAQLARVGRRRSRGIAMRGVAAGRRLRRRRARSSRGWRASSGGRRRRAGRDRARCRAASVGVLPTEGARPRRGRAQARRRARAARRGDRARREASSPTRGSSPRRRRRSSRPSARSSSGYARSSTRCDRARARQLRRRRALAARPRAVRHAVRPGPHAAAADRARLAAGALPRDPRRRDERQVVDGAHRRGDPRAPRRCAPARSCRRTSCRSASASAIGDADLRGGGLRARRSTRVARAAEKVDRTLRSGDRVTQFEALTAAALRRARAARASRSRSSRPGLGGRWDATNVIDAEVVVLTNVGLEHTRWLGPTVRDIAREKLAVVRRGATLVLGADLHPDAATRRPSASRAGARGRRGAGRRRRRARRAGRLPAAQLRARAHGGRGARSGALDEDAVRGGRGASACPAASRSSASEPLTILDGAHNPGGMHALADVARRPQQPLVAVVSVLDDKDAAEMLRALLPARATRSSAPRTPTRARCRRRRWRRSTEQLGGRPRRPIEPDPHRALARARELAGPEGAVLATGSIYLVADLLPTRRRDRRRARRCERRRPLRPGHDPGRRARSSRSTILVFFALGYVFGRLFL